MSEDDKKNEMANSLVAGVKNLFEKIFLHKKIFIVLIILIAAGYYVYLQKNENSNGISKVSNKQVDSILADEPEEDYDIYGMIGSIRGNEIKILEFSSSDSSDVEGSGSERDGEEEETDSEENAISLGGSSSSMPGGGNMPSGGDRGSGGPGGFGESTATSRETMMETLEEMSIGTDTVTVPVGIPIVRKAGSSTSVVEDESATLEDLTSDTLVIVWLKESDDEEGEVVEKVAAYIEIVGKVDMGSD